MFTRDELRAVPLFANLADRDLDYLAATSADIHVLTGEYVINEGETRRAFFVLIDGGIEVTKFASGVERILGRRVAGEAFGEVPVIFDTPSLVNFRATATSRVMRIERKDLRALSASAPQFAASITAAALERVEGLQEAGAARSDPITILAPRWDQTGHQLREFLQRMSIEFNWSLPDDPAVADVSLRLGDGRVLVSPSLRDVALALDLCVEPRTGTYDVAIVGGGPAGLASAVYGASEGLATILIEQEVPGGQAGTSSRIENYLGFPFGIAGDDLTYRALQQAHRLGAQIVVTRCVQSIDVHSRALVLDGGTVVSTRSIILATGVTWRQLEIETLSRFLGRGVYYGAAPGEERSVQGKDIYLVGGGNSAGQAAINFSNFANSVTLLVRGESLTDSMSHYLIEQLATKSNVRIETRSEIVDAFGDDHLEGIVVANRKTDETTRREAFAVSILIGADAFTTWLPAEIERDSRGYILTGPDVAKSGRWPLERHPFLLETSVPGIFAAGDVRAGSIKRVAAGVGEGSMAIAFVHQYLA